MSSWTFQKIQAKRLNRNQKVTGTVAPFNNTMNQAVNLPCFDGYLDLTKAEVNSKIKKQVPYNNSLKSDGTTGRGLAFSLYGW